MKNQKTTFESVDEYIASFSPEIQVILQSLRQIIKASAPDALEKISYQMPTFELQGNLVHFAAFKKHIGFYPAPSGILEFQEDIKEYHKTKGSLQFPIDKPLPTDLISRVVKYKVLHNIEKAEAKSKKKN